MDINVESLISYEALSGNYFAYFKHGGIGGEYAFRFLISGRELRHCLFEVFDA